MRDGVCWCQSDGTWDPFCEVHETPNDLLRAQGYEDLADWLDAPSTQPRSDSERGDSDGD